MTNGKTLICSKSKNTDELKNYLPNTDMSVTFAERSFYFGRLDEITFVPSTPVK